MRSASERSASERTPDQGAGLGRGAIFGSREALPDAPFIEQGEEETTPEVCTARPPTLAAYRVKLRGATTSFRRPRQATADQPSLPTPPPSTVYGMTGAAAGSRVSPEDCVLGYVFDHRGEGFDIETLYRRDNKNKRGYSTQVVSRQILFDWQITLYFLEESQAAMFREPVVRLSLGRSQDLATIVPSSKGEAYEAVELEVGRGGCIAGTALPLRAAESVGLDGANAAAALSFSAEEPRSALGVRPRRFFRTLPSSAGIGRETARLAATIDEGDALAGLLQRDPATDAGFVLWGGPGSLQAGADGVYRPSADAINEGTGN